MTDKDIKFFGPNYIPKDGKVKNLIFLLHGYGANGDDLIDLASIINKRIPETAFYAPNAPFPLEAGEFFMPAGYQWFSLEGYDPERNKRDPEYFENLCNKRFENVKDVLPKLWEYFDDIIKKHNVAYENVVIAGFSQGGFMSLLSALTKKEKIAGAISFSGVPLGSKVADFIENKIPVLLTHGDSDDVVPHYAMGITEKTLSEKKIVPEKHTSKGVSHGIDNYALDVAINFLEKNLLHK